jgi:hypothetical protein
MSHTRIDYTDVSTDDATQVDNDNGDVQTMTEQNELMDDTMDIVAAD